MRLSILGPGHVLLQSPRGRRWLLLGLALLTAAGAGQGLASFGPLPPVLLSLLAAAALLVAALVALLRHSELELQRHTLSWRRRGVFADTDVTAPRTALRHLRLSGVVVTQQHDGVEHRSLRYLVELICEHQDLPPVLELLRHHRELAARRFGEALARASGLPLLDALGDVPELRAADALDGPPRARAPVPPAPAGTAVRPSPDGRGVLVRAGGRSRTGVAVAGALLLGGAAAVLLADAALPAPLQVLFVVAIVLPVLLWLAAARRRQRVFVHDGELHVVHDLLGLPLRHRRLPTAAIERVRMQGSTPASPQLQRGLAVVSDRQVLVVGSELPVDELRWLSAWVESQVWPELPVRADGGETSR